MEPFLFTMILQELITHNFKTEAPLLYHRGDKYVIDGKRITILPGGVYSTDTYFNSFSMGKWTQYTKLTDISLSLRIKGSFRIGIFRTVDDRRSSTVQLKNEFFNCEEVTEYEFELPIVTKGVLWYELEAVGREVTLIGSSYFTRNCVERDVKLAVNICTFRREEYLFRNVELIRVEILDNPQSELYEKVHIFITDNAGTVLPGFFDHRNIHLEHNENSGGSGGFTRGLKQIIDIQKEENFTHTIFMDDDVGIEIEALLRAYRLLKILDDKYRHYFLAGAMLRLDNPTIQHENGALWNGGKCRFIGRGVDLSEFSEVVRNEAEFKRDYAAWWFCCICMDFVRSDNLPLPLFIHQDDVEYSLRNAEGILCMNGIGIWHEVKGKSHAVTPLRYYNLRNKMIVNRLYGYRLGQIISYAEYLYGILTGTIRRRGGKVKLLKLAVKDYRDGVVFNEDYDSAKKNEELNRLCEECVK